MPNRPASHRFSALVPFWHAQRDACRWVLATLSARQGPSYRKPGAQVFINDLGQWFGVISGGCLEADLMRLAQEVLADGIARTHAFIPDDAEEDGNTLARTGCGGSVWVRLQEICAANHYLDLDAVHAAIMARQPGVYWQDLHAVRGAGRWIADQTAPAPDGAQWLGSRLDLPPHLFIFGGGVDARPLAQLALALGWQVSVCDARTHAARSSDFGPAVRCWRCAPQALPPAALAQAQAVLVMHHHVQLDAEALQALHHVLRQGAAPHYVGMLGPAARRAKVLARAGLQEQDLHAPGLHFYSPAGSLRGADLPEDIALSLICQIQQHLHPASQAQDVRTRWQA
ncbi:XdhC family protein [Massilia sp. W12]|uniref:XdhC family protein n=1 Tax=Massilia sp. W12 TaxID=3126507 RepID=UPI0030D18A43